jgi:hypothetical protein
LRGNLINQPAQLGVGIRYHPLADGAGFLYLVAIFDVASRNVVAFRLP